MSGKNFLKGLARGLTADVLGAPVDAAQAAINLGLAGYGYIGNKLGLLKPDQMPSLLENSLGTSDWFAKNTFLEDKNEPGYTLGRVSTMALPLVGGLASRAKTAPSVQSQKGALRVGGDPRYIQSHAVDTEKLLGTEQKLPRELYNPSFAITVGDVSRFNPETVIIPHLGKLDPKLDKTVLTAVDYYTPRYNSAAGARYDTLIKGLARSKAYGDPNMREETLHKLFGRLADRYATQFPRGGFMQEGLKAQFDELSALGKAGPAWEPGPLPMARYSDAGTMRITASPRFQSFEHFEKSPQGGLLLRPKGSVFPASYSQGLLEKGEDLTKRLRLRPEDFSGTDGKVRAFYGTTREQLETLASGKLHPGKRSERGRKFDKVDRPDFDYSDLRVLKSGSPDDRNPENYRELSPAEIMSLQVTARQILSRFKTAKSDYAENKLYGGFALHPQNVAGIMGDDTAAGFSQLQQSARNLKIPFEPMPGTPADRFALAEEFQKRGQQTRAYIGPNRLGLNKGLASVSEASLPATSFQGLAQKPAKDFSQMSLADLKAMNTGPFSHDEFKNWIKAVNDLEGKALNQAQQKVPEWLANADYIPPNHMMKIEEAVEGDATAKYLLEQYKKAVVDSGDDLSTVSIFMLDKLKNYLFPLGK